MIKQPPLARHQKWLWLAGLCLVYALIHLMLIGAGHLFKVYPENIASFWPVAGFLLATLLLIEYRLWPVIAVGFLLAEQAADFIYATTSFNPVLHSLFKLGNGIQAFLSAYLIRRFVSEISQFSHMNYVIGFVFCTGVIGFPLGAVIGASAMKIFDTGVNFWQSWSFWYGADMLGMLLVTPMLIIWFEKPWRHFRASSGWQIFELLLSLTLLVVMALMIFSPVPEHTSVPAVFELPYVLYPLLVWLVLRFHISVSVTALFGMAVVAIWFTHSGRGLFYFADTPDQLFFFELKAFLALTSLFTLFLNAIISERRQAQDEISEQQRKLSTLMSNLPGMVYRGINCPERDMEFVSAGCKALTGYGIEEIVGAAGKGYAELIHPKDRAAVQAGLDAAIKRDRPFHLSYRILTADDKWKWVLEQGQIVFTGKFKEPRVEGFVTDITERKQAEQALVESEERYRRFIETSVEGIWRMEFHQPIAVDLPVNIQVERIYQFAYHAEVNRVYLQQYAFASADEAEQMKLDDIAPKADLRNIELQKKFVENGYRLTNEISYEVDRRGNDKIFLVNIVGVIEDGFLVRSWGMQIDVTEQKQIEEEQRKLQMQVQQLQKHEALGVLASGIAHDFNNILTGSLGFTDLALGKVDPENRVHYYLNQIRQSCERARDLVAQILAFSRPDPGKRTLVKMTEVLNEALAFLRASLPDSIRITDLIVGEESSVLADSSQIYQVIINLCTNASQAMPNGGVLSLTLEKVSLSNHIFTVTGKLEPGDYMLLRVNDTGDGMTPDMIERIFDPFFTTKTTGTGLGLSVVLGIVNSHGGGINVLSQQQGGTTLEVYLPFCADEVPELTVEVKHLVQKGNGQRILVVDDDSLVGRITQEMLSELNYVADVYKSSTQALAVFNADADAYDLVITDWTMPEMNGLELVEKIRERRSEIPAILITGEAAAISQSTPGLIQRVLIKPLSLTGLATTLADVFDTILAPES